MEWFLSTARLALERPTQWGCWKPRRGSFRLRCKTSSSSSSSRRSSACAATTKLRSVLSKYIWTRSTICSTTTASSYRSGSRRTRIRTCKGACRCRSKTPARESSWWPWASRIGLLPLKLWIWTHRGPTRSWRSSSNARWGEKIHTRLNSAQKWPS